MKTDQKIGTGAEIETERGDRKSERKQTQNKKQRGETENQSKEIDIEKHRYVIVMVTYKVYGINS